MAHSIDKSEKIAEVYSEQDWEILKSVYQLLADEQILNTPASSTIVDFKFPDELKVNFE